MRLQIAFDLYTEEQMLELIPKIVDFVDIIEIGTVAILRYGCGIVQKVRAIAPDAIILADAKIADAGFLEAEIMFQAGADIVTVLGAMHENTLKSVKECAVAYQKEMMVDLIGITEYEPIAKSLQAIGPDYVCSHLAVDIDSKTQLQQQFARLKQVSIAAQLALAGGVTLENLDEMMALNPDVVIVGRGILTATDVVATTKKIWEKIHGI